MFIIFCKSRDVKPVHPLNAAKPTQLGIRKLPMNVQLAKAFEYIAYNVVGNINYPVNNTFSKALAAISITYILFIIYGIYKSQSYITQPINPMHESQLFLTLYFNVYPPYVYSIVLNTSYLLVDIGIKSEIYYSSTVQLNILVIILFYKLKAVISQS